MVATCLVGFFPGWLLPEGRRGCPTTVGLGQVLGALDLKER